MEKTARNKFVFGMSAAIALLFGILIAPIPAAAQTNCIDLSLQTVPLFGDADLKPGDRAVRTVAVANAIARANDVRVWAENYFGWPAAAAVPADDLARALNFTIRRKDGADVFGGALGKKSLYDFFNAGQVALDTLAASQTQVFELEIFFDPALGNEWQKKTTKFDIVFGSECGRSADGDPGTDGGGQTAATGTSAGSVDSGAVPSNHGTSGDFIRRIVKLAGASEPAVPAIVPQVKGAADEQLGNNILKSALGIAAGVSWQDYQWVLWLAAGLVLAAVAARIVIRRRI
jgi:hypothetical protein